MVTHIELDNILLWSPSYVNLQMLNDNMNCRKLEKNEKEQQTKRTEKGGPRERKIIEFFNFIILKILKTVFKKENKQALDIGFDSF